MTASSGSVRRRCSRRASAESCTCRSSSRSWSGRGRLHRGAIRIAPSSRIVSPLSIGFSTICWTSAAYSSGRPSRLGCGTCRPSDCFASSGKRGQQRRLEEAGGDRDDPDLPAGELAGDRQRHADDAALGGRVGRLADLALEGGDRGRVDEHPPLLVHRVERGHRRGRHPDHIERADEVDLDDLAERRQRHRRAVLADHPGGRPDAGAADHHPQRPEPGRQVHRGRDGVRIGDVRRRELAAEPAGDRLAVGAGQVEHHHPRAEVGQPLGGRPPEPGRAPGDQRDRSLDPHPSSSRRPAHLRPSPAPRTRAPSPVVGCLPRVAPQRVTPPPRE